MLRELNLNEMMLVSGGQDNSGEGEGEPEEPPQPEQEHIEPESDTLSGSSGTGDDSDFGNGNGGFWNGNDSGLGVGTNGGVTGFTYTEGNTTVTGGVGTVPSSSIPDGPSGGGQDVPAVNVTTSF